MHLELALELTVAVLSKHWTTARASLREEEDSAKDKDEDADTEEMSTKALRS